MSASQQLEFIKRRVSRINAGANVIRVQNRHRLALTILFLLAAGMLIAYIFRSIELHQGEYFSHDGSGYSLKNQIQTWRPTNSISRQSEERVDDSNEQSSMVSPKSGAENKTESVPVPQSDDLVAAAASAPAAAPAPHAEHESKDEPKAKTSDVQISFGGQTATLKFPKREATRPIPLSSHVPPPPTFGILFAVSVQSATVISIIALLIIRRSIPVDSEQEELSALEVQVGTLVNDLKDFERSLETQLAESDLKETSIEVLAAVASEDSALSPKIRPGLRKTLQGYSEACERIQPFLKAIESLESQAVTFKLTMDRVIAGYVFAGFTLVAASIPIAGYWITDRYFALASISCTAAASAYALLGRVKTTESKFIDDLKSVNAAVGVLFELGRVFVPNSLKNTSELK